MSLGGNLSSGYTDQLNDNTIRCAIAKVAAESVSDNCCSTYVPGRQFSAVYSSIRLASKVCPPPTVADFARFPKVATPSSARTQFILDRATASLPDFKQRFTQYTRYNPPTPCSPLPPTANMAGKSIPSSRPCNLTIR
jgi:hypothetical protein